MPVPSALLGKAITAINAGADNNCVHTGAAFGTNDTIAFNIPLSDPGCNAATQVCRITIANSNSLFVGKPMVIDGYTQPSASANALIGGAYPSANGLDTQIKIEVTSLSALADGFVLNATASPSEIRGLAIFGFGGRCIGLNSQNSLIDGNFIGLAATGVAVSGGSCGYGISASGWSSNNTIGGFTPASRNVIANALIAGIRLVASSNNVIAGNLIGTDSTGTVGLGATTAGGILIQGSLMAPVNGNSVVNNVIADWGGGGIWLEGADGTAITGNAIGIGVGGVALGNGQTMPAGSGIWLQGAAPTVATANSQIANNGVAYNGGDGILVAYRSGAADPTGNRLDRNAIFSNGGMGINLQPSGEAASTVTANDVAPDADTGPNGLQNAPIITSVTVNGTGGVDIAYTLDSAPNGIYAISAYASDTCKLTGYGEGRYLANVPLSWGTDGAGHLAQTFTYAAMPPGWGPGMFVTLLATSATSNETSEFSACMAIPAVTAPIATPSSGSIAFGNQPVLTASATQTVTITNTGTATLSIGSGNVTLAGADAGDFSIVSNVCNGITMASGASCAIGVSFTPATAGARTATLSVTSNDPASPLVIALAGNGVSAAPTDTVSVPTLSERGLILLSLLMAGAGMRRWRSRTSQSLKDAERKT